MQNGLAAPLRLGLRLAGFHISYALSQDFTIFNILYFYMALSHKDWELTNAWIWLAEMDIDRGLDFSI